MIFELTEEEINLIAWSLEFLLNEWEANDREETKDLLRRFDPTRDCLTKEDYDWKE